MLTHLEIKNFRGINELTLNDVGRINLVVGRNDTGKTSLFEAIRLLLSGDPRYLRRNRNSRERRPPDWTQDYELAFYQAKVDSPISIDGTLSSVVLSLRAQVQDIRGEQRLELDSEDDEGSFIDEEELESLLQPGRKVVVEVTANKNAIATIRHPLLLSSILNKRSRRQFVGEKFPDVPPLVWLGTNRAETWLHARHYSTLYRNGGAETLLNVLKNIEPRLRSLVVLTPEHSGPSPQPAVLEVDLGFDQTLPLDSMGDGFSNIISIVSAIGAAKKGLCLIDEVDYGIHYSLLPQVWRSILSATNSYDSQIWATTHSYDCICAIHEALQETPDALRVHRLDRKENGVVTAHTFDYDTFSYAIERGLEVR